MVALEATSWDGKLIYAVSTTGIFCRPSCPARRPRRDNVRLFNSCDDAEKAGFRACKRCTPTHPSRADDALIKAAVAILDGAPARINLNRLAKQVGLDPTHLAKRFKALVGVTPNAYQAAKRSGKFRTALAREGSVTDAALVAGYRSKSRAYHGATERLGMSPTAWRGGGAGESVRYTVTATRLGPMLVAWTERGVCEVAFATSDLELLEILRGKLPKAELVGAEPGLWVDIIGQFVEGRSDLDLPLDVVATAFQASVWRALRQIPAGETRTYSDIAVAIGHPSATRAVASAIGANPVAVVVPCHRVIRKDGSLGGFRWGLDRKRALLAQESCGSAAPPTPGNGD